MKFPILLVCALTTTTAFGATKCKLTTVDGTWEYIGAPEQAIPLPGGITMSTAQGTIEVVDGEIVGGTLGQYVVTSEGAVVILPATVSDGTIELDTANCRIRAAINAGVAVQGIQVPANFVGRGEYSRIARAIIGRARSLLTGAASTFVLRRPQ